MGDGALPGGCAFTAALAHDAAGELKAQALSAPQLDDSKTQDALSTPHLEHFNFDHMLDLVPICRDSLFDWPTCSCCGTALADGVQSLAPLLSFLCDPQSALITRLHTLPLLQSLTLHPNLPTPPSPKPLHASSRCLAMSSHGHTPKRAFMHMKCATLSSHPSPRPLHASSRRATSAAAAARASVRSCTWSSCWRHWLPTHHPLGLNQAWQQAVPQLQASRVALQVALLLFRKQTQQLERGLLFHKQMQLRMERGLTVGSRRAVQEAWAVSPARTCRTHMAAGSRCGCSCTRSWRSTTCPWALWVGAALCCLKSF